MAMDITERKRAEEAFKERHRQLQGILDYAPIGISLKDTAGNYKWVNRHYEQLTGKTNDEMVGKKVDEAYRKTPDSATFSGDSARTDQEVIRTGEPLRQENFLFLNRTLQRTKFLILDEDGTPNEVCSIVHDVTDRVTIEEALRENEEQLRLILEAVGEGIYGLDLEGRGTFVNPAVAELTGFRIDELIGQMLHPLIHHSYPDGTPYPVDTCPMYAAFTDGTPHQMKDEVLWRKDGTSFPVEYTSTPLRKEGKLVGTVVTFNDVTERRAAEQALEESLRRLQDILDNSPMLISVKGRDGRYKIANRYYEVLSGIKGADMIGKTASERFPDNPRSRHADRGGRRRDIQNRRGEAGLRDDPHLSWRGAVLLDDEVAADGPGRKAQRDRRHRGGHHRTQAGRRRPSREPPATAGHPQFRTALRLAQGPRRPLQMGQPLLRRDVRRALRGHGRGKRRSRLTRRAP